MKQEEFQTKMNNMQEKLGQEASNLILDDIGVLLNDNKAMNISLEEKNREIEKQKKTIETLQNVNGNLLQQVSMGNDEDLKPTEEKKPIPFDFRSAFDENRKF